MRVLSWELYILINTQILPQDTPNWRARWAFFCERSRPLRPQLSTTLLRSIGDQPRPTRLVHFLGVQQSPADVVALSATSLISQLGGQLSKLGSNGVTLGSEVQVFV